MTKFVGTNGFATIYSDRFCHEGGDLHHAAFCNCLETPTEMINETQYDNRMRFIQYHNRLELADCVICKTPLWNANDEDHQQCVARTVTNLDFRRTVQFYIDYWRNEVRECRKTGNCVICGISVFSFTDGQDDPRGPLGDHADDSVTEIDGENLRRPIAACFMCMNEEGPYTRVMARAQKRLERERRLYPTA